MPVPCPVCSSDKTRVFDTRATSDGGTKRRLKCPCGHRFTTAETVVEFHGAGQGFTVLGALKAKYRDTRGIREFTTEELLNELLRRERERG